MLRITALMACLLATPALAQAPDPATGTPAPSVQIITTLIERGYRILEDERTWLGRQRIIAEKDGTRRELVFHPGTGEILRDYSVRLADSGATRGGDGAGLGATRMESAGNPGSVSVSGAGGGLDSAPGVSVGDSVGVTSSPSVGEAQE